MNYTKTNPFRLHDAFAGDTTFAKCNKCGWIIYIGLEDYYYRESVDHNSTQAWRHKHCFGRQNRSRPNRPSATPRQKQ